MYKLLTEYLQDLHDHVWKCEGTDQGRDGYLAWVHDWKRYYRELPQNQQIVKWEFMDATYQNTKLSKVGILHSRGMDALEGFP